MRRADASGSRVARPSPAPADLVTTRLERILRAWRVAAQDLAGDARARMIRDALDRREARLVAVPQVREVELDPVLAILAGRASLDAKRTRR